MRIFTRYCYKTYVKDRAWKQVVQWFVIGATSILFLGTFAVADAYAAAVTRDIEGETTAVGDPDEGELDFEADPGTGSFEDYSARLYFSGNYTGDEPDDFELRGWVWNPQFGWISLYCGPTQTNQGVPCGDIEYGVKVNLQDDGRMYGWAWGDNVGWISFNCEGTINETLECGSSEYGSYLAIEVNTDLGTVEAQDSTREPMAWADTVGKFSLNGIGSSILDLMINPGTSESQAGVWTKVENFGSGNPDEIPTKNVMPAADSKEAYVLFIHIADILGNPITDPSVTVDISTNWIDTIQRDQTIDDQSGLNLATSTYPRNTNGFTVNTGPATTTGGVIGSYYAPITSNAPTDEGNCYDPDNDGCDFYYREFADVDIPEQKLEYLGGSVTITVPSLGSVTVDPIPFVTSDIRNMDFVAPIEIDNLSFMLPGNTPEPIGVIQATRNKIDTFNITAKKNGDASNESITLELTSLEDDVKYNFIDTINDNPFFGSNIKTLTYNTINALTDNEIYAIPFTPNLESAEDLLNLVAGAELRSTIEYGSIKYYNNGLPRTDDSEIINQTVAILSGSVFSPGAIQASSEAEVTIYGDVAVYEMRTRVLEDVSSLIRGITIPSVGTFTIDDTTTETELANHSLKKGRIYFFEDTDVHLESMALLPDYAPSTDSPISIILRGGDLYVDGNINEFGDPTPIGLIVLESNTDTNEATKGGHIYVKNNVTDMVEVSIFADGPMYRYVDGICFNSTDGLREPNFVDGSYGCDTPGDYKEPISSIPNTFYLKGNIATSNCLGCSVSAAPTRGDGTIIPGGTTAKNFAIARLYDFNYFSYFRLHPETSAPMGAFATNVPASAPANRPVYIEYSPAPSDMFGLRSF
ncbi:hypothetical protein ACFL3T_02555 [Patescibacteria group bacterium]